MSAASFAARALARDVAPLATPRVPTAGLSAVAVDADGGFDLVVILGRAFAFSSLSVERVVRVMRLCG